VSGALPHRHGRAGPLSTVLDGGPGASGRGGRAHLKRAYPGHRGHPAGDWLLSRISAGPPMGSPLESGPELGVLAVLAAFLPTKDLCSWSGARRQWRRSPLWRRHWSALTHRRPRDLVIADLWVDCVLRDGLAFHGFAPGSLKTNFAQKFGVRLGGQAPLRSPWCPFCGASAIAVALYPAPGAGSRDSAPDLVLGCPPCISARVHENPGPRAGPNPPPPRVTVLAPAMGSISRQKRGLARGQPEESPPPFVGKSPKTSSTVRLRPETVGPAWRTSLTALMPAIAV
jgi:hypothetical protein